MSQTLQYIPVNGGVHKRRCRSWFWVSNVGARPRKACVGFPCIRGVVAGTGDQKKTSSWRRGTSSWNRGASALHGQVPGRFQGHMRLGALCEVAGGAFSAPRMAGCFLPHSLQLLQSPVSRGPGRLPKKGVPCVRLIAPFCCVCSGTSLPTSS